jgi:hypothetical protein
MKYIQFLTLTKKVDNQSLDIKIDEMHRYFRNFVLMINKKGRKGKATAIVGGVYVIEIVEKPEGWFVHIHAICDCRTKQHPRAKKVILDEEIVKHCWNKVSGDYIVKLQKIFNGKDGVINYLLKYVTKPLFIDSRKIVDLYLDEIRGKKLVQVFGKFYDYDPKAWEMNAYLDQPFVNDLMCPDCGSNDWDYIGKFESMTTILDNMDYRSLASTVIVT